MDPTIVTAIITGGAAVVASGVGGYFAGRRGGSQESSSASGTPPRVVLTNPRDQAYDVPVEIFPTVNFNDDMDDATINPNTFKLLDMDTLEHVETMVPNGVVYDESTRIATFHPAHRLQNGRRYAAIITARVKNQGGNRLEQDKMWHFRTSTA